MESWLSNFWEWVTAWLSSYGIISLILAQLGFMAFNSIKMLMGSLDEIRMSGDAAALTGGATGVATATGTLDWINMYAPAIGLMISALSALVAAIFYYLNYRINRRQMDERLREEIRAEFEAEGR